MRRIVTSVTSILRCALLLAALSGVAAAQDRSASPPLTVVELFQSQGCSSCPPAQANLNAVAGLPNILALSYGVTYWDSLGWKDSFAKQAYTDRQYAYAHYRHRSDVFTPQVYIDGQTDLVGSDAGQLQQAIVHAGVPAQARARGPSLSWSQRSLRIGSGSRQAPADVWLVRYDPRTLEVAISAGENGGRTLPHRNVVRELLHLGVWHGGPQTFDFPAPALAGLATAVLLQEPSGGAILSASKAPYEAGAATALR